jgi:hypothetical protein
MIFSVRTVEYSYTTAEEPARGLLFVSDIAAAEDGGKDSGAAIAGKGPSRFSSYPRPSASRTRAGVSGYSRSRVPVASKNALAIAAAAGPISSSPPPLGF